MKIDKGKFVGRDALIARRVSAQSGEKPYQWKLAYLGVDADVADVHSGDGSYADGLYGW